MGPDIHCLERYQAVHQKGVTKAHTFQFKTGHAPLSDSHHSQMMVCNKLKGTK